MWLLPFLISACDQVSNYEAQRKELIKTDQSLRFSADLVLTPNEQLLNEKLVALRTSMKHGYDSLGFFPPAQPFLKYKSHVEETKLFQLLRKMPKGGIHHLHPSAGVDFQWLIDQLVIVPNCFVYWEASSEDYLKGQIGFFGPDDVPEGYQKAALLAKNSKSFKEDLFELLTFSAEPVTDSLDIWIEFENIFQRIGDAYSYRPLFVPMMDNLARNLLKDGVFHMEYRLIIPALFEIGANGEKVVHPVDTTIHLLQKLEEKLQKEFSDFSHKAIYTSLRFLPKEDIANELVTAYEYRKKYPDFIKGFDLVAEEDNGHTTYYFKDSWEMMDSLEQVHGIDMPLYLHDGESNSADIINLYDAALLRSKRIGHGFNLMYFPTLVDLVKEQELCIEVSPLSNQILGYVKDLRRHPATLMIRNGVQISISSDDPSIFNYMGLSYDYWYVLMAWELDLKDLKKLIFNSITYSALESGEKSLAFSKLEKRWEDFVKYGNEFL